MSNNYAEENVSGTSFIRCKRVEVHNPYVGTKSITFTEEKVIDLNGKKIRQPFGNANNEVFEALTIENASSEFNILNPADNSVISTMSYQEVYNILYSLYLHLANERDARDV